MQYRWFVLGALIALASLVSACLQSAGNDSSEISGFPPTTPASTAIEIVAYEPADGAKRVGVLSNFQIRVSGDVTPEALDALKVTLQVVECRTDWECVDLYYSHATVRPNSCGFCHFARDDITLQNDHELLMSLYQLYFPNTSGKLSYDAVSHSLVFKPDHPLFHDARYRLVVSGITDSTGQMVPSQSIKFSTSRKLETRRTLYYFGEPTDHETAEYSPLGLRERSLGLADPGIDGIWFTKDDVAGNETNYFYDDSGLIKTKVTYSAGVDGLPGIADEDVNSYNTYQHGSSGLLNQENSYTDPGKDLAWFTADDVLSNYDRIIRDNADRGERYALLNSAGADKVWFTADDVVPGSYFQFQYDDANRLRKTLVTSGAGADGLWLTPDDTSNSYWSDHFDDQGRIDASMEWSPGADGTWLTEDDISPSYRKVRVDEMSSGVRIIHYEVSTGVDAIPFNNDDAVTRYLARIYDESGNRTGFIVCAAPGPDGEWFTEDDPVSLYIEYRYNDRGLLAQVIQHVSPGADARWLTGDDGIYRYATFTYDSNGNMNTSVDYDGPGVDGLWFTDDDQKWIASEYVADL